MDDRKAFSISRVMRPVVVLIDALTFFTSQTLCQQQGVGGLIKPCPTDVLPCTCRHTAEGPELECSAITDASQLDIVGALKAPNHFKRIILQRTRMRELPRESFGEATADIYVIQNNPILESIDQGALGQFANPKEVIVQRNPTLEEFPFDDLKK